MELHHFCKFTFYETYIWVISRILLLGVYCYSHLHAKKKGGKYWLLAAKNKGEKKENRKMSITWLIWVIILAFQISSFSFLVIKKKIIHDFFFLQHLPKQFKAMNTELKTTYNHSLFGLWSIQIINMFRKYSFGKFKGQSEHNE